MKNYAFTMAEILLSLTIIGVVAAITLPSLTGNINERTWNTQRKALYARMSQAISLMPALNGYGTLVEGNESTSAVDTATETFITDGLAKVLKINNICDSEHLGDCGIPDKITPLSGSNVINNFTTSYNNLTAFNTMFNGTQINTKAAAFETQNGESIVVYYNPNCKSETIDNYSQVLMCANFVYDLNGTKGPNTVGKDIGFVTALYPSDTVVVAPMPLAKDTGNGDGGNFAHYNSACKRSDAQTRLPNIDELSSMCYNRMLLGIQSGLFWSSSVVSSSTLYKQSFNDGRRIQATKSADDGARFRCIHR